MRSGCLLRLRKPYSSLHTVKNNTGRIYFKHNCFGVFGSFGMLMDTVGMIQIWRRFSDIPGRITSVGSVVLSKSLAKSVFNQNC